MTVDRSPAIMKVRIEAFLNLRKELEADLEHLGKLRYEEVTTEHTEIYEKIEEVLGK